MDDNEKELIVEAELISSFRDPRIFYKFLDETRDFVRMNEQMIDICTNLYYGDEFCDGFSIKEFVGVCKMIVENILDNEIFFANSPIFISEHNGLMRMFIANGYIPTSYDIVDATITWDTSRNMYKPNCTYMFRVFIETPGVKLLKGEKKRESLISSITNLFGSDGTVFLKPVVESCSVFDVLIEAMSDF